MVYSELRDQSSTWPFQRHRRVHHLVSSGTDPIAIIGQCGGLGWRGDAGSVPGFGDRPRPIK